MKKIFFVLFLSLVVISPVFTVFIHAQTTDGSKGGSATIDNPLGSSDMTLSSFIGKLLELVARIGAVVCVFFIIYAGFLFVKAQGNEAELEKAKSVLLWSVIGAAVLLGASVMSKVICETVKEVVGSSSLSCS